MTLRHTYRFVLIGFAVLFLAVQSLGLAHAVSFNDAPHEHDGQVCVLDAVVSDDDITALPVGLVVGYPRIMAFVSVYSETYISATTARPSARAPPPRAPPYHL